MSPPALEGVRSLADMTSGKTGQFGADMLVTLANDGPATFIVDSRTVE